jgi:hypothetical protein
MSALRQVLFTILPQRGSARGIKRNGDDFSELWIRAGLCHDGATPLVFVKKQLPEPAGW